MARTDSPNTTNPSSILGADAHLVSGPRQPSSIDRAALMRAAHQIARQARPHMANYRDALSYGLRAAWGTITTQREFAAVRARVAPVTHTAKQLEASRAATRRCGTSYMPF